MNLHEGSLRGDGLRIAIVASRFNDLVVQRLYQGAIDTLRRSGIDEDDLHVAWVPGAVEIPLVAGRFARSGDVDAVVTLGAVIRGATSHYDYVCSMVSSGVARAAEDSGVPVVFGVLTTETLEQALDRAGGKVGNKGSEAAMTAIEMATLIRELPGA